MSARNADWHEHVCECGASWWCSKPRCRVDDECEDCEGLAVSQWLEENGYEPQPTLALTAEGEKF